MRHSSLHLSCEGRIYDPLRCICSVVTSGFWRGYLPYIPSLGFAAKVRWRKERDKSAVSIWRLFCHRYIQLNIAYRAMAWVRGAWPDSLALCGEGGETSCSTRGIAGRRRHDRLRRGFQGVLWSIVGTNATSLVLIGIAWVVLAGIGQINPTLLLWPQIVGSFYLLHCGYAMLRSANAAAGDSIARNRAESNAGSIVQFPVRGFLVGVSNPKDVIFFMAFFPPFVSKLGSSLNMSMAVLTVVWCILDYSILILYGRFASVLVLPRHERLVLRICALIFIAIAVAALADALRSL